MNDFQIEEWNPLTDTVPVHAWILPWLPWLASRFETTVFPIIRNKLGAALQAWHASDASAKRMLEPWREVFSQGDMEAFLTRHIVPKLAAALHELIINPHQQHLGLCFYIKLHTFFMRHTRLWDSWESLNINILFIFD